MSNQWTITLNEWTEHEVTSHVLSVPINSLYACIFRETTQVIRKPYLLFSASQLPLICSSQLLPYKSHTHHDQQPTIETLGHWVIDLRFSLAGALARWAGTGAAAAARASWTFRHGTKS